MIIQKHFMAQPAYATNGYVILLSTLVVAAVSLTVVVALTLLSTDTHRTSLALLQSNQAKALANACAEQALEEIRQDDAYVGTDNLSLGQGTCTFVVTDLGGESRNIQASGTVSTVIRRVEIEIDQIYNTINIISWQEVADF